MQTGNCSAEEASGEIAWWGQCKAKVWTEMGVEEGAGLMRSLKVSSYALGNNSLLHCLLL